MAKVKFFYIEVNFLKLIGLTKKYPSPDDFAFLVFQLEIADSNKKIDEYEMTAYVVDKNGKSQQPVGTDTITAEPTSPHPHEGKLCFGNYPWSRKWIQLLVDSDPDGNKIDYILFTPQADATKKYVVYKITAVPKTGDKIDLTGGDTLNPCPPYDP